MSTLTGQALVNLAAQAGFGPGDDVMMAKIALVESGGKTDATHQNTDSFSSIDYGLWMINSHWHAKELKTGDWKDPKANAKMALSVFNGEGFNAWYGYRSGAAKKADLGKITAADSLAGGVGIADPVTGAAPDIPGAITSFTQTIAQAIPNAVNAANAQVGKVAGQSVAVLVAVVFLALGVVFLLEKPALAVAGVVTPAGKAATIAKTAGAAALASTGTGGAHRAATGRHRA